MTATASETSAAAGALAAPVATDVTFKILRFNPEVDEGAHWEEFVVSCFPTDRVLTALEKIKGEQDGSLTFRRSCGHGICGSDAMRINGRNRLACKTLIKDLNTKKPITVEALKASRRRRTSSSTWSPSSRRTARSCHSSLQMITRRPGRIQSAEERAIFDDTTKCILCAACTTSCPVFWNDDQYFGPQAIIGAHRFIFDSRDAGTAERLEILNSQDGVWRCRTTFNCTEACPRGIEITDAIRQVKKALLSGRP